MPGAHGIAARLRITWLLVCVWLGASIASATPESGSLVQSRDQKLLFSANFDTGSVSRLDASTGERQVERAIGRDVRRVALSQDERVLAATDYLGGRLVLLDSTSLRVRKSVELGGRPFGVIHEPRRDVFWVTLFEAAQLVAVDRDGEIRERVSVHDTPRGLALTADGRLLVTHALIGAVSIFDVKQSPIALTRAIVLRATSQDDPFASQGAPRLLDDIAIHPDQRSAWLPHVLWSFGHPFQFRSTIFPAVSVLSLEPGAEHEVTDQRKELFRQIDLLDTRSKTRIASNPHDLVFDADGTRGYLTLSGSEDLLVFDLSRSAQEGGPRRSRRKGKQSQGGAQAVQIVRHLPGDLPSGIVVVGDHVVVQNAVSLDLSRLARGGEGPFARVSVTDEVFARPVENDPMPAAVRRGQRVFFSGNTDEFAEHPLAGDFWMSCASCHLDGFNFTNRYLMRDAELAAKSAPGGAANGHRGLKTLVSSDFVGDYVRMIQDTQGGMGADERAKLPRVDPDRPPAAVTAMMNDLHAYVTASHNLPFLSTWLRVEPARSASATSLRSPAVDESEWTDAAQCATCHSEIYAQWQASNHHFMSTSHPYYRVLEDLAASEEGEEFRAWCMGCHNPKYLGAGRASSRGHGEPPPTGAEPVAPLGEGTDCLFCHRVTNVEHAGGNASLTVNLADRERYPLDASESGALRWFGEKLIAARPSVHARSYLRETYTDSRYCGSCHTEFAPGSGAQISDTYAEWAASPFNVPNDPAKHRECADCHMHGDVTRIGEPLPGHATDGGRLKPNVRAHRFVGANVDAVAPRSEEAAEQSLALLRAAAKLETSLESGRVRVRVRNVGAGHHLPTGVTDLRELWLHVRVTDAKGGVVLESGKLDENGEHEPDSRLFNKVLGDAQGKPVGLRFWRYETLLKDTRIPAGAYRDEWFELPASVASQPLRVEAELLFRTFPRALSEQVRLRYPDLVLPRVHTLARVENMLGSR